MAKANLFIDPLLFSVKGTYSITFLCERYNVPLSETQIRLVNKYLLLQSEHLRRTGKTISIVELLEVFDTDMSLTE